MLLNVMVTQIGLYGVEVWGGTVSLNAWNEMFLRRQLGVKCTTSWEEVFKCSTSWKHYKEYIGTPKSI